MQYRKERTNLGLMRQRERGGFYKLPLLKFDNTAPLTNAIKSVPPNSVVRNSSHRISKRLFRKHTDLTLSISASVIHLSGQLTSKQFVCKEAYTAKNVPVLAFIGFSVIITDVSLSFTYIYNPLKMCWIILFVETLLHKMCLSKYQAIFHTL